MSWKQFIASVIASLAWSTVVLVLAIVLRSSIVDLIVRLRRIKHKDTELEFEQQVMKIESALPPSKTRSKALPKSLEELVVVSPRAAVMESWTMVESLFYKKAIDSGALEATKRRVAFSRAFEVVWKQGVIDPSTARAILEMRELRNRVAHDENAYVGIEDARRYAELASSLVEKLL